MTPDVQGLVLDSVIVVCITVLLALKIVPVAAGLPIIGSIVGGHAMMRRSQPPPPSPPDAGAGSGGNLAAVKTIVGTSVVAALGVGLASMLHRRAA